MPSGSALKYKQGAPANASGFPSSAAARFLARALLCWPWRYRRRLEGDVEPFRQLHETLERGSEKRAGIELQGARQRDGVIQRHKGFSGGIEVNCSIALPAKLSSNIQWRFSFGKNVQTLLDQLSERLSALRDSYDSHIPMLAAEMCSQYSCREKGLLRES